MPKRLPPKPYPVICALPTHCSPKEAELYQKIRDRHCADGRPGHQCLGRLILDKNGMTASCPRCGDVRMVYPKASGDG